MILPRAEFAILNSLKRGISNVAQQQSIAQNTTAQQTIEAVMFLARYIVVKVSFIEVRSFHGPLKVNKLFTKELPDCFIET